VTIGELLASGSDDNTVRLWGAGAMECVACIPDRRLVAGDSLGEVYALVVENLGVNLSAGHSNWR
jgi:hypothetical protein